MSEEIMIELPIETDYIKISNELDSICEEEQNAFNKAGEKILEIIPKIYEILQ